MNTSDSSKYLLACRAQGKRRPSAGPGRTLWTDLVPSVLWSRVRSGPLRPRSRRGLRLPHWRVRPQQCWRGWPQPLQSRQRRASPGPLGARGEPLLKVHGAEVLGGVEAAGAPDKGPHLASWGGAAEVHPQTSPGLILSIPKLARGMAASMVHSSFPATVLRVQPEFQTLAGWPLHMS